jgi:dynein light chain roadblock-type
VEEAFNRIKGHKGVKGILIVNGEGVSIRSTLNTSETNKYGAQISALTGLARSTVREIDPTNDLLFLRIRSKKHEIMVAPDREFLLIVIQNPEDS